MPQNSSNLENLLHRFGAAEASEEEVRDLFRLIALGDHDPELLALLQAEMEASELKDGAEQERRDKVLRRIREVIAILEGHPAVPAKKGNYRWLAVAAAVLVMAAVALFFFNPFSSKVVDDHGSSYAGDVAPGKVGATLTLANGKKIVLSDAASGKLASEAGVVISKSANGELVYEIASSGKGSGGEAGSVNTLTTAKGETYQVRLPDGSVVWLNAASSLTYATNLKEAGVRRLKLSGEAYFEVAKLMSSGSSGGIAGKPGGGRVSFIVETDGQQVQVLGTHFNIRAYTDEADVRTTLLEGSVQVSVVESSLGRLSKADVNVGEAKILKPGEQAKLSEDGIKVSQVNTEEITSWRKGYFDFRRVPLGEIMKDLSRWYDIEVSYAEASSKDIVLSGYISRSRKISGILKRMEATGVVRFRIEDKKVFVYPASQ